MQSSLTSTPHCEHGPWTLVVESTRCGTEASGALLARVSSGWQFLKWSFMQSSLTIARHITHDRRTLGAGAGGCSKGA